VKISMENLMTLIPQADDRARIVSIGANYKSTSAESALDDFMSEIERHWRAVRRPQPSRTEVAEMLRET